MKNIRLVTNSLSFNHIISSIEDVIDWIKTKQSIQVDTETEGWFDFSNKILTLQIGDKDTQFVIDCTTVDISPLKPYFKDPSIEKVFWNAIFDLKFLYMYGFEVENIYDGFLAECLLSAGLDRPKGYLSLNSATKRYLGVTLDKDARGLITSEQLTDRVIAYAANDVRYLHDVQRKQLHLIKKYHLEKVLKLENDACLVFAEIEFNGMGFDKDHWSSVATYALDKLCDIEDKLNNIILSEKIAPFIESTIFGDMVTINWKSTKQVTELLNYLNLDVADTKEATLNKLKHRHPLIQLLLNHREEAKRVGTYGPAFLRYINKKTGRIHTSFFQILKTGRISSGSSSDSGLETPNMQNIPADNKYRNAFIPGYPDYLFVSADYSSQELALLAEDAGEDVWIEAVNNGWDIHSMIAQQIFTDWEDVGLPDCKFKSHKVSCSCPEHKKRRTTAKTFNYALPYGAQPPKIADTLQVSIPEAIRLQNLYFTGMPKLKSYFNKIRNFGRSYLRINSMAPYRRIRFFEDPRDMHPDDAGKYISSMDRWSVNTRIQATGADICKSALVKIRRYIIDHDLRNKVKIVLQVHDQIDTICHKDFTKEWAPILKRLMEEASAEVTQKVTIRVDLNISERWEK